LFVCTANICRSPTAEVLARAHYGEQSARFRSAGFLRSGEQSPDLLVRVLAEKGIDVTGHRSYELNRPSLAAADLVLTMESEHVQQATLIDKRSFPKIMPLKEAAEVALSLPTGQLSVESLLEAVNRHRDPTSYLSTQWDVADPYNRKLKHYRQAVAEIENLVHAVIGRLS
jgi:protein-tyrosine-phosphatase